MRSLPMIAVVGRPNVGKSTLFNRLVGRRQSIVHDTPGVTRDRISATFQLEGTGLVELVDTGGLLLEEDALGLNAQVRFAVEESDLLILVVDGIEGLTAADEAVWQELRAADRPTLLVVAKGDTKKAQASFDEFYSLGVGEQFLVSAEHALGIGPLLERLAELLSARASAEGDEEDGIASLAIVGRPNVGKSSLLNLLLGAERSLVSPKAGTTRDPVDTLLERDGKRLRLVDTAGIRRRSQVEDAPESLAIMMAKRQIARADVVALLIDSAAGVTSGDVAVAAAIWELGRSVIVVFNKWDLLDEESRERLEEGWERLRELLKEPPRINLSAKTGRSVQRLLPMVDQALVRHNTRLGTPELNRMLELAVQRHHAPTKHGKPWNLLYATQVATGPPIFVLFANRTLPRQDAYRRYLENSLRGELELGGVPIRLSIRRRDRKLRPEDGSPSAESD